MHAPSDGHMATARTGGPGAITLTTSNTSNIATLKREADCEIARILRCCEARWEPERPRLVPPRTGAGSGVRG